MKPRGKIRGFQEKENGDIRWGENLPTDCRMSLYVFCTFFFFFWIYICF